MNDWWNDERDQRPEASHKPETEFINIITPVVLHHLIHSVVASSQLSTNFIDIGMTPINLPTEATGLKLFPSILFFVTIIIISVLLFYYSRRPPPPAVAVAGAVTVTVLDVTNDHHAKHEKHATKMHKRRSSRRKGKQRKHSKKGGQNDDDDNDNNNTPPPRTGEPPSISFVAMDCEMVGVGRNGVNSMLARCSLVTIESSSTSTSTSTGTSTGTGHDDHPRIKVLYDAYVKPTKNITDYRTQWSGITPEHLSSDAAVTHDRCRADVISLLKSSEDRVVVLVGHALENDFEVLRHTVSTVRYGTVR